MKGTISRQNYLVNEIYARKFGYGQKWRSLHALCIPHFQDYANEGLIEILLSTNSHLYQYPETPH